MSAADFVLNPLPASVQWSKAVFATRDAGGGYGLPASTGRVLYGAYGDLTGDGWPEIVISGWSYRGWDASGTPPSVPISIFSTSPSGLRALDATGLLGFNVSSGTAMIRIADFTGDGRNDLLTIGHNESPFTLTPSVLFASGASGFSARAVGPKVAVHEGQVGDFNGDGRLDYVASAYWAEKVFDPYFYTGGWVTEGEAGGMLMLQINQGDGSFKSYPLVFDQTVGALKAGGQPWTATHWSSGSASAMADFDNDGKVEIVVADLRSSLNWNRGDTYLISNIGFDDVSAAGRLTKLPAPYFEDKAKFAGLKSDFPGEISHDIQIEAFDFDNDGLKDILVFSMVWHADNPAGIVQFLRNKGGLEFEDVTEKVLFNTWIGQGESSHEAIIVDVNGDGFQDIILPGDPVMATGAAKPDSWANEVLVNTGAGKFVSVMWSQFHDLVVGAGGAIDEKAFPYLTPDGRLGFVMPQYQASGTGFLSIEAKEKISTGPGGVNPALRGAAGFSEAYYLTENPGVAAAVGSGVYVSGLEHYLAVGRAQGLHGFARNARVEGSDGADVIVLREGDETARGGAGDDRIDGGAGTDTVVYDGASANYTWTQTAAGWTVTDNRAGSPDGTDTLISIEALRFSDRTVSLAAGGVNQPVPAVTTGIASILRGSNPALEADLSAKVSAGTLTQAAAIGEIVKAAEQTTSVATLSYLFFTGKIPGSAGIDYLVSASGPNPNNLNSAYFQNFNLENRYINFAVNLGKDGEGKAGFAAEYGSLSLFDATKKAYAKIFGAAPTDAQVTTMLSGGRDAYFASYGGDGLSGQGTKAAMVGWLLAEAEKADLGVMARSNAAWLTDLADGSAPFAIDITAVGAGYYKSEFVFGG